MIVIRTVLYTVGILLLSWVVAVSGDILSELQYVRDYSRKCLNRQQKDTKADKTKVPEVRTFDSPKRTQIQQMIRNSAIQHGVDPELALAVAEVESGFNQFAVSSKGAFGIMQIMPITEKELGIDRYIMKENIDGGIRYIKLLIDEFGLRRGLAAYNFGPDNVRVRKRWPSETREYVERVLVLYRG